MTLIRDSHPFSRLYRALFLVERNDERNDAIWTFASWKKSGVGPPRSRPLARIPSGLCLMNCERAAVWNVPPHRALTDCSGHTALIGSRHALFTRINPPDCSWCGSFPDDALERGVEGRARGGGGVAEAVPDLLAAALSVRAEAGSRSA